jgi:hypothetical protein
VVTEEVERSIRRIRLLSVSVIRAKAPEGMVRIRAGKLGEGSCHQKNKEEPTKAETITSVSVEARE